MSDSLYSYLGRHAVREARDAEGAADIVFFGVKPGPKATAEELRRLIKLHAESPEHEAVDLFDGKEHSYLELGAWLGDQGLALALMGLGAALGLWKLLTPHSVLGDIVARGSEQEKRMAGMGYISITAS